MKEAITQEYLKSRLHYDPVVGVFIWKFREEKTTDHVNWNRRYAGTFAGKNRSGYRVITMDGVEYRSHRLAWFYVNGTWPEEMDHINRIRSDNRIANLRDGTHGQNMVNASIQKRRGSKLKWAYKRYNRYEAKIFTDGKCLSVGSYETELEAHLAAKTKAIEIHGDFAKSIEELK